MGYVFVIIGYLILIILSLFLLALYMAERIKNINKDIDESELIRASNRVNEGAIRDLLRGIQVTLNTILRRLD